MSKRGVLHLELTFTLNVSFRFRTTFVATDTYSLTLDIPVVLGPESTFRDAYTGPR